MRSKQRFLVHGALAGALGAATMTVMRMFAHRAGWIQAMVPQAVEVWAKDRSPFPWPQRAEAHHVADQLLHLGYGGIAGAAYALTQAPRPKAKPSRALELGGLLWAFGSFVLFPALKIARPPWRATPREEAINLAAHLAYGAVTAYLLDEFERQRYTEPFARPLMRHAKVG
jgi:hypothetical protein